ncbi:tryptophan--tRNA ligase [Blattabacterium cuenoti]|uniref:tryptophan--tRNA ligase n=1 Tax=Blattabacterium cuenoti TaxID=1653831 RepID=UPI00163D2146|nr:tryptophan--tRNA ligase [Blattabacterium cuenoti]
MKNMLTGIRSTGNPHLGNILSVIIPSINMITNKKYSSFIFIADLHSIIQTENIQYIKNSTYNIVATWLAFGLNTENSILYRQSDVTEVTELAWYLSCFFPYKRLTLVHSFKKEENKSKINVGLFTYPILMAADILLYNAEIIPVGKDQLQHIEIARRIAYFFNKKIGKKVFSLPNPFLQEKSMFITGTDGSKMSKSKNNYIDIFSSDEILKKQIMNIKTDSKSLEEKKNPDPNKDYIMYLYKLVAPKNKVENMKKKYVKGGYGYSEAKMALYEEIIHKFSTERNKFFSIIKNKSLLDKILFSGAKKAKSIAINRMNYIRKCLNFKPLFSLKKMS